MKRINQTNSTNESSEEESVRDERSIPESSHQWCTKEGGSAQRSHWVRDTGDKRRIRSFFFTCIADRVRDIVGQQLEIRKNKTRIECRIFTGKTQQPKNTNKHKRHPNNTPANKQNKTPRPMKNSQNHVKHFFFELMPCALEAQTVIKTFCLR